MSIQQAKQWLSSHTSSIPVLEHSHQQLLQLADEEENLDLARIIRKDPGLCLALLQKVNARRDPNGGRELVESIRSAISLLSEKATLKLFEAVPEAGKVLHHETQKFAFDQLINRSLHNEMQAEMWAREQGHQQLEPLRLSALLAYSGEILCCVHDFETYQAYMNSAAAQEPAEKFFGFNFDQLTESLCQALKLPELIIRSLPQSQDHGPRARLLRHTTTICLNCENGWYSETMQQLMQAFADEMQIEVDKAAQKTHQFSIIAARESSISGAWQPAARLILIADQGWTAQPEPAGPAPSLDQEPSNSDPFDPIKRLVRQPDASQSQLLQACVNILKHEFAVSKVSLLLLSKDQQWLQNRMSIGIDEASPFRNYRIELRRAGLLKMLLNKPQAIWINKDSFKKYQKLIPQSLIAHIMTDQFLAMSLFIGDNPVGIVYADRSDTAIPIDQALFTRFKQLVTLTSKALTLLSKKQQSQ